MTMGRAAVIGAGGWGTTLAKLLSEHGHRVRLWSYEASVAEQIRERRVNEFYLPGIELPAAVEVFTEHADALEGAEVVIAVVPSHAFREVMCSLSTPTPWKARRS